MAKGKVLDSGAIFSMISHDIGVIYESGFKVP